MKEKVVKDFDYELAKKIFNKEIEGEIICINGNEYLDVEILTMNLPIDEDKYSKDYLIVGYNRYSDLMLRFDRMGRCLNGIKALKIRVLEEVFNYKEGAIIAYDGTFIKSIGVVNNYNKSNKTLLLHFLFDPSNSKTYNNFELHISDGNSIRLANEIEKKQLLTAISCINNKTYINLMKNLGYSDIESYKLTPGTPVIGKDGNGEWRYDFFSHMLSKNNNNNDVYYRCVGRSYSRVVPYEGNEDLLNKQ